MYVERVENRKGQRIEMKLDNVMEGGMRGRVKKRICVYAEKGKKG